MNAQVDGTVLFTFGLDIGSNENGEAVNNDIRPPLRRTDGYRLWRLESLFQ